MNTNVIFDSINNVVEIEHCRKMDKGKGKDKEKQISSGNTVKKVDDTKSKRESENQVSIDEIEAEVKLKNETNDIDDEEDKHPYRIANSIMTKAESKLFKMMASEFNRVLKCVGKQVLIFPKIRLGDIVTVKEEFRDKLKYLYKVAYKHIDYLVCDSETFEIVCAIELDDFYHTRESKMERDKFVNNTLKDCGIELFRIGKSIRYVDESTLNNIVDFILDFYAPICPKCGKITVSKKYYGRNRYGHRYYGCSGWKTGKEHCDYKIEIDQ